MTNSTMYYFTKVMKGLDLRLLFFRISFPEWTVFSKYIVKVAGTRAVMDKTWKLFDLHYFIFEILAAMIQESNLIFCNVAITV